MTGDRKFAISICGAIIFSMPDSSVLVPCRASQAKFWATLTLATPMCIDADAITLIAAPKQEVLLKDSVMTPHEGEMRRLIPHAFKQITCRVSLAQIAAKAMGCVILFKVADTVIAQPSGAYKIVKSQLFEHAAWLATAGSGDVLSGIITGLLARGFHALDAAAVGNAFAFTLCRCIWSGLNCRRHPRNANAGIGTVFIERSL